MALPIFDPDGNLPPGIHPATIADVIARFDSPQRQRVTSSLLRVYNLASATNKLERFIIFGSYITSKPDPTDVDIVLIMSDDFNWNATVADTRMLFEHDLATVEFNASIFWMRPALLILETLDEFIEYWQITRAGTHRGIVEVRE